MGCYHYERAAEAARKKIEELEKERKRYVETETSIKEAQRAIKCYTDFLGPLGTAMSSVIVNGKPFDKGKSAVHHDKLQNGIKTMDGLLNEITEALREIANEILAQEAIIDNEYTCGPCSTPATTTKKPAL